MERRKTRLSVIGICLIMILSIVLAVFGITNVNQTAQNNSVSMGTNQGADIVAATDSSKYIGGVPAGYKTAPGGPASDSNYIAIRSGAELRAFLRNEGNYQNKNGYLDNDITDFNWDDFTGDEVNGIANGAFAAGLSPRVELNRKLDGCGYTINFVSKGTSYNKGANDISAWAEGTAPYPQTKDGTNAAGWTTQPNDYIYATFGGLVSALTGNGELKNFTFKINNNHTFLHDGWDAYRATGQKYKSIVGGLVGYQGKGSKIENVAVELANDVVFGVGHTVNAAADGSYSDSIVGLVTGMTDGGSMADVKSVLGAGSKLVASSAIYKTLTGGSSSPRSGRSYVGGVIGQAKNQATIKKVMMQNNGGVIRALLSKSGNSDGGNGFQAPAGIVSECDDNVEFSAAMVTGQLDCLQTDNDGYVPGVSSFKKNLFTANGKAPSTQIYINGAGGTNKEGDRSSLSGSYTVHGDVIFVTAQDVVAYFDKTDSVNLNMQIYIPEHNVVWSYMGTLKFSEVISGRPEDDARRIFEVPKAAEISQINGKRSTYIEVGTVTSGEIGFYEKTTSGDRFDGYDENGNHIENPSSENAWKEVSDQVRVDADKNQIPLYYNGTSYAIKIYADITGQGKRLYDEGLTIKARGDLTNASNGKSVTLYTRDSRLAYRDEARKVLIMLDQLGEGDLNKTLTIKKRYLGVETDCVRGVTSIFDKATVKFTSIEDMDENSGLAGNDTIKWQDANFPQDYAIDLNVAGHQMLRPSTNNYILMMKKGDGKDIENYEEIGSYFATELVAHEIEVDEGIYINGESILTFSTREAGQSYGIYKVKNARTDNPEYNETKRKLVITVRVNDNHFTASRVRFYGQPKADGTREEIELFAPSIGAAKEKIVWTDSENNHIEYKLTWRHIEGIITTPIYINDGEIGAIRLEGRKEQYYNVTKKIDGKVTDEKTVQYLYGQRTNLEAQLYISDKDGSNRKVFVGWQREKDNSFISYQTKYSLKVTEDFVVNAVYAPIDESKTWTQEYYGKYGSLLRTIYYVSEDSYSTPEEFKLPDSAGFLHGGKWTFNPNEDVDSENRVIKFHAIFTKDNTTDEKGKLLRPMVNVVWTNSEEHKDDDILVDYGQPIVLKAGNTYLVDNTLIECDKDYTIYAITDMNIIENPKYTDGAVDTSLSYSAFKYTEEGFEDYGRKTEKWFFAITFTYGKVNATYGSGDKYEDLPKIEMDGFNENDFTQYIRSGNIYQISMVITKQELECRFGNDSEISTFLTVNGERLGDIIIFRRKSTDTSTQRKP